MKKQKAVFIDRDGVLIEDVNLLTMRDQIRVCKGVPEALKALSASGYQLFVVTNQTVVARGLATEKDVKDINAFIAKILFEKSGCQIERFYYCPHHPTEGLGDYKQECECRKPKPGMFISARDYLKIDMANSVMIGDKTEDMIAAEAAEVGTNILVRTGKPVTEKGELLATAVLDSVADVPAWLATR